MTRITISHYPTWQLREAARAWRAADHVPTFFFGRKPANGDLYDKIDDMIEEIERLRRSAGEEISNRGEHHD